MLKGSELLAKINEMQTSGINYVTPGIVLACGYVKETGKPDFVGFYTEMLDAKGELPSQQESDEEYSELRQELNEEYGEDAVDAFLEVWGEDYLDNFADAYVGEYRDGAQFAEEMCGDMVDVPSYIIIDWDSTWECGLRYDYTEENGFFFRNF
jgi:hypothetical protein